MMKLITAIILFIGLVLALFYITQRKLIYFPVRANTHPAAWGLADVKAITLKTKDKVIIAGWHSPAQTETSPTLIYFHGNAGHMGYRADKIKPFIKLGYGVLIIDYRGYGQSEGTPSEQGLYADGRAAMNYLISQGLKPSCTVVYGVSLGAAIAVQMATEYKVGALILRSPFNTLSDVGRYHYPFLPVAQLLKDKYASDEKIAKVQAPVFIAHGGQDKTIPLQFGQKLFERANQPKDFLVIPDAAHNNMPDISKPIHNFLSQHHVCQQAPSSA